jgi:serine/threonine protein phosphatase PrpC
MSNEELNNPPHTDEIQDSNETGVPSADEEVTVVSLEHAARSDIGMKREENQDSFGIIEGSGFRLFIVADGMGGVQGGALASSMAIETIKEEISPDVEPTSAQVAAAIQRANSRIFAKGSAEPSLVGMGTTLVALLFRGTRLTVFNVGDSRAYRFRHQQVDQLTEDHTLVMELVRSGSIDINQAKNHPVSHMLTRSLGPAEEVEVDVFEIEEGPYESEMFLICSDGLYNLVKDGEMLAIMLDSQLDGAVDRLIDLANKRGGSDNITIIAVEAGRGFPAMPQAILEQALGEVAGGIESEDIENEPARADTGAKGMSDAAASSTSAATPPHDSEHGVADTQKIGPDVAEAAKTARNGADTTVNSRLSMETLRASYQERKSQHAPPLRERIEGRTRRSPKASDQTARPSVMASEPSRSFLGSNTSAILSLVGAVVCGYMVSVLLQSPESYPGEGLLRASTRSARETSVSTAPREERRISNTADFEPEKIPPGPGSIEQGLSTIERRQRTLSSRLRRVEEKISALEAPLSGQLNQLLTEATKQRNELEQKLGETKGEVEGYARRLAVWNGRRVRLESSEPITMVSEIAVSSEEVRRRKDAFEAATWQYLKEAERLEYAPNDAELAKRVTDLVRARNDRMDELFVALRDAVSDGILDSQQKISELTIEADRIEREIKSLEDTISFSQILSSPDASLRSAKRTELLKEKELILGELNELNRLAETLPALRVGGR